MVDKQYYIIKNKKGEMIRNYDNSIIMGEYPIQVSNIIDRWFNGSLSLKIEKFKGKNGNTN